MANTSWNGLSGDWTDPAQWSDGVPVAGTDALITATGTYVVTISAADVVAANSVTLNDGAATLQVFGSLTTDLLAVEAGTVEIDGAIANATIALDGGAVTFGDSALASFSTVIWTGGALDLGAGSATVLVSNGLTVQGTGAAPGTVDLEGSFSNLDVIDTETLSTMTINVGSATGQDALSSEGTLTLDTTTTINLLAGAGFAEISGQGTVINDGTINAAATDGVINATEFGNAGQLTVDTGATLSIQPGDVFINGGTVTVDAGGTLDVQFLNGFLNTGAVTIEAGGFFELGTTALTGGGTLDVFGTLDASGQVLAVGTAGIANSVEIDGTVQNATIALAGGVVRFGDSAVANFSNVSWIDGALDLGAGSATVLVSNGLTVQGTGGAPGTVNLEGSFSNLDVIDTETLSTMTINVGSATGQDALSSDGTLTLDTTTTVNLLAGADFAEISGVGMVINDGTINAAATDGVINVTEFTNAGQLVVGNGGTLAIQPGDVFTNSGTVTVDAGGTLDVQFLNSFVNTGAVTIDDDGFLELGTTALSGGGTLDVFGTLDGSDQVLTVGTAGIANAIEIDGTVQNATIALAGGAVTFGDSAFASFSDVAWTGGALDLGAGSATVLVSNGLTVQGTGGTPGTVDLEGSFSNLDVIDTETLSDVTINVGSAAGQDALSSEGTLTLDTTTTVNLLAGAGFAEISGQGTVINDGTINAAATNGVINATEFGNAGQLTVDTGATLSIQPGDVFINGGTVTVDAGGTLDVQFLNGFLNTGAVTIEAGGFFELGTTALTGGGTLDVFGTLDASGQVLAVGTAGIANSVEIDGTLQNATIALAGGAVTFGDSAVANFSDVSWIDGALDLGAGSATVLVSNGLTVQGTGGAPGTLNLEGSFSNLDVIDTETLSNMTINVGSATGQNALSSDGTLTLDTTTTVNLLAGADFAEISGVGTVINDGTINAAATDGVINATEFTNAGQLTVDNGGTLAVQPGDVFTNSGTVTVDAGGTLDVQFLNGFLNTGAVTIEAGGFFELGTTALTGGGTLDVFGTLDASGQVLAVGTAGIANSVEIDGTLQNATIALAGGAVTFGDSAVANFSNVSWIDGALDLGAGSATVLVTDGLTVQGTGGAPGTVNLEGSFSNLDVIDTETLSTMTINVGSAAGQDALSSDGTLTLDTTTTVNLLAGADFAEISGVGTVINDGTINAAATDGVVNVTAFTNAGAITVDSAGSLSVQPGDVFTNSGTVTVDAGGTLDVQFLNSFVNTGVVNDLGGSVFVGAAVTGAGTISLSGGVVELQAGASGGDVSFAGTGGTLVLDTTSFTDTLTGFDTAGTLDLTSVSFVAGAMAVASGTTLTLTDGATTETFALSTAPADGTKFFAYADTNGGTDISSVPCYCPGTLILTANGEKPVETLAIGDELVTAAGQVRPIRWIGRRGYTGRFAARNRDVLPVLIRAGAIADGLPKRDLMVSPLHAMFIDGVLIPAAALVNGQSITVVEDVERVDYIHLELDSHDVILAEGAPAESFVDDGSRGMFHNAAEYHSMHPDAVRVPPHYCAPRLEDGETVEAIRRRLAARVAPQPAIGTLLGRIDLVTDDRIQGWARSVPSDAKVQLRILDGEVVLGEVTAQLHRPDLEQTGIGDGRFGFELIVPGGLSPAMRHVIRVQRIDDARDIEGSPFIVEAATRQAVPVIVPVWEGMLDVATRTRVAGWARDAAHPDEPVALQVLDNGVPVGRVLANRYRADLQQAGIGAGRHAFDLPLPGGLSPLGRHVISVRFERDGTELACSPMTIEPANSFDAGLEQAVANAVAALSDPAAQDRVLSFMAGQLQRLQQAQADADGRRADRLAYDQFTRRHGPQAATLPDAIANPGLRALVIDARIPMAARDAGSVAVLSHMRALQQLGYEVSFVAADELQPMAGGHLDGMGVRIWGAPHYNSVEDVLRRQAGCFDVVYLHRAAVASRYLALARTHQPRARVLYSVADLHHVRLARQAAIEDRPELMAMSHQMRVAECTAAWSADAVITHSADEAAILRQAVPGADVHVVAWDVPVQRAARPFAERAGVAFIGGYAHTPNVDAAQLLVESVMPLVWQADPAIICTLVGSEMPAAVRALARPGVEIVGQVHDLAAVLDQLRLTVAPLRYGAGVKGKVVESFAAGVPCVMSPVAAEGLDLPKALQGLVGTDAAALAAQIVRLHSRPSVHQAAAKAGRAMIRTGFCGTAVLEGLRAAIEGRRQVVPVQAAQ